MSDIKVKHDILLDENNNTFGERITVPTGWIYYGWGHGVVFVPSELPKGAPNA